jgi:hypothetical protein
MTCRLAAVLERFRINDRAWLVLERRIGPSNKATLEDVALEIGVTRERVRQIQKEAYSRISRNLRYVRPLLESYEDALETQWLAEDARWKGDELRRELESIAHQQGWCDPGSDAVRRLVVALRAAIDYRPELAHSLPVTSFAVCLIDPPVRAHQALARKLGEWAERTREQRRSWTYNEIAEAVLREAGTPLHWRVMADRAEALGKRQSFSTSGFFNAVQANDDKFARVDTGTYGLVEWGLVDVENYTDIVAEVLYENGCAMTAGRIFQEANSRRPTDPNSLRMMLDLDVRFYRAVDQTYGLRSWLPERHLQTLRTPDWLVEDLDSYERVSRAERRGYRVDAIVQRDRERYPRP